MKKTIITLTALLTFCTAINTVKADTTANSTTRIENGAITSVSCENGSTVINFAASDGSTFQYKGNFYLEPGTTQVTLCINTDNEITDWWAN